MVDPVGGLLLSNRVIMENSTVVNNSGVGIFSASGSQTTISNSIIADNDTDCQLTDIAISSDNMNNLDTDGSCDVLATNHITVQDAMLGPLTDNGGPTLTHLPLVSSPVIDSGDNATCLQLDQRGETRPFDGDGNGSDVCDIGAIEYGMTDDIIFKDGFD